MSELMTWRKMISQVMQQNGDVWENVESHTLTQGELDAEFDAGYGGTEGAPFTLWTKEYVYFPGCYDGAEWCDSVPRNPCGIKTEHVGGE